MRHFWVFLASMFVFACVSSPHGPVPDPNTTEYKHKREAFYQASGKELSFCWTLMWKAEERPLTREERQDVGVCNRIALDWERVASRGLDSSRRWEITKRRQTQSEIDAKVRNVERGVNTGIRAAERVDRILDRR